MIVACGGGSAAPAAAITGPAAAAGTAARPGAPGGDRAAGTGADLLDLLTEITDQFFVRRSVLRCWR